MRIPYETMLNEFKRILMDRGIEEKTAFEAAENFAQTSLDGVYSHGINRFLRVVDYIDRGIVDANATPTVEKTSGFMERWNGNQALGNTNAQKAMNRAIELAKNNGMGLVAIKNTNHWMRGGAYGWQAADEGCIGICFTNTMPNMPAFGARDRKIGNNPFIIAIPRTGGAHVVIDMALSQFSYGKIEEYKLKNEPLPVPGGYDTKGEMTTDAAEIEKSWRVLPVGFWKGSGLSIVLDMMAAILSGGNTVGDIGESLREETGLSQVMIAIDPTKLSSREEVDNVVDRVITQLKSSEPAEVGGKILYPGESSLAKRKENQEKGIPVVEDIWNAITQL